MSVTLPTPGRALEVDFRNEKWEMEFWTDGSARLRRGHNDVAACMSVGEAYKRFAAPLARLLEEGRVETFDVFGETFIVVTSWRDGGAQGLYGLKVAASGAYPQAAAPGTTA